MDAKEIAAMDRRQTPTGGIPIEAVQVATGGPLELEVVQAAPRRTQSAQASGVSRACLCGSNVGKLC